MRRPAKTLCTQAVATHSGTPVLERSGCPVRLNSPPDAASESRAPNPPLVSVCPSTRTLVARLTGSAVGILIIKPKVSHEISSLLVVHRKSLGGRSVPGGIRTPNLLIRSQKLYPVELQAL